MYQLILLANLQNGVKIQIRLQIMCEVNVYHIRMEEISHIRMEEVSHIRMEEI